MVKFLCNLTWGRGSVGDEAILAGLLTEYNKDDVIVGSFTPKETADIYGVKAVNEQADVSVDTLVVGGGFLLPSSLKGLNDLVDGYKRLGCRVEARAVQILPSESAIVNFLRQLDYVSVRNKALQQFLNDNGVVAEFERDFAFLCPSEPFEHNYHGWIGYNAINFGGGGYRSSQVDLQLPEGKILGIAGCVHRCDNRENDFIAIKQKNCDDYFFTVNPMKMRYLLSTLKRMYSKRKHLALLSHISGTPTYYYGRTESSLDQVREWGVSIVDG